MFCFAKFCRLCLQRNGNLLDFLTKDSDNIPYLNKIKILVPSLFVSNEDFIGLVCEDCRLQIHNFYSFINNCFKTRQQIMKYNRQLKLFGKNQQNEIKVVLDDLKMTKYINSVVDVEEDIATEINDQEMQEINEVGFIEGNTIHTNNNNNNNNKSRTKSNKNDSQRPKKSTREDCVCKKCGKFYYDRRTLYRHHTSVHLKVRHTCYICNKTFTQLSSLHYHERRNHLNLIKYECTLCNINFGGQSQVEEHFKSCKKRKTISNKCYICNKDFSNSSTLIQHNSKYHSQGLYRCEKCNKSFKNILNLHNHENIVHFENNYKCHVCSLSFKTKSELHDHLIDHKVHVCSVCNKSFPTVEILNLHHQHVHKSTETPEECVNVTNHQFNGDKNDEENEIMEEKIDIKYEKI